MELTDGFSFEDKNDEAMFATDILCLAMQLRFEKRDVRKKQLLTPGNLSPAVVDYIFDTDIPRPCRWFLGREQELEQLHGLLVDHSKVFLHGIPGIGKSELAKAYAKQYGINYPGDLKQVVIDLDFADDLPDETDDTRFKQHNRFLRSLREDTLLIVDNFNVTASQDQFLDVMLKYRCRILFTTRSRYENHISLEVGELNPDTLLKPKELLTKLQKEKAALDVDDKIGTTKDGRNRKATYYDHMLICTIPNAKWAQKSKPSYPLFETEVKRAYLCCLYFYMMSSPTQIESL